MVLVTLWQDDGVLPRVEPMLASSRRVTARPGDWAVEPKLDGWRALVYVDGLVTVRTRRGKDISPALPELAGLVNALDGHSAVLDGELVVGYGHPWSFYKLRPKMA